MTGLEAAVAIIGIIAGTILLIALFYGAGRDIGFFKAPECLGIMGRLKGHKYTMFSAEYIQPNCLRCGKRKEGR